MAANKQRIPLAKLAVAETGMGIVEDKVIKNHYAAEYTYNTYKRVKTCGVVEQDTSYGIKKIAEPVGIVGAVIPTTNPTSTAIFKCLDLSENQKRHHHQSPSQSQEVYHRSSEDRTGGRCKSRSTGRHYRLGRGTYH